TVSFTAGPPQVSVRGVSVFEGNGEKSVAVLVELSSTTADAVTVSYATEDATANAGSDYRAASGTLTFAPGEITKTINIVISGDTRVEDDESLLVRLSSPVNAILGSATASVKLVNDDLSYRAQYGLVYAAPMTLDLYTPTEGTGPFPLIVFVPGTIAYDASDPAPAALRETSRGYAVAVVRYRTPNAARFPAQLDDLRAAVRWLRTSALSLNIETTRIAAWGNGAGAHLASLLGTANDAGAGGSVSGDVQSVIAWGGASDLMQLQSDAAAQGCGAMFDDRNSAQSQLIGCALPACTQSAIAASPLSHVTSGDAAFLLLHTRNDCTVPLAQTTRLHDALRAAGVRATMKLVDDAAHGLADADAFLDAQLQPRTSRRRAANP
ncbi:MAG TPA: Calx-beta domain-containing protein, partial [Thermoanaerobaculia bacterium]|nr:Calx-beta domain-containing protein [Thermoanaerobaculia bacterium]